MSNENTILSALRVIVAPGEVFEVRAPEPLVGRGGKSGYFDDVERAAKAVAALDGKYEAVYITLNPVNRALLARAANRVRDSKKTTSDGEVVRRRWLLIDADPDRPSGISSTEEEHQAAFARARDIREWLSGEGWPLPVEADSGNGAHLLYRVDLDVNDAAREMLSQVLQSLAARFDDDRVKIDQGVFNASRITKMYGSLAKKGDALPDRPHRRSLLISTPDGLSVVDEEMLRKVAELAPKRQPSSTQRQTNKADDVTTATRALEALSARRRDDYHEWVKVGMALQALGNEGLSLWERWSSLSPKYQQGDCDKKWRTFKGSGTGLGSLIKWADEDSPGWRESAAASVPRAHSPTSAAPPPVRKGLSVDVAGLLASINQASDSEAKARAVEDAVMLIATMPALHAETALKTVKDAVRGTVKASTIDELLRKARRQTSSKGEDTAKFYVRDGNLWAGSGEDAYPITAGGYPAFTEMVKVDDGGGEQEVQLTMEIRLHGRSPVVARVPGSDSGDANALVRHIRGSVGPLLSVLSPRPLCTAVDVISRADLHEVREIARTGWIEGPDGLCYVSPGGVVGQMPDDWRVRLSDDFSRFAVTDCGDEAFKMAINGLIGGFMQEAFAPRITYLALAFALLPVAARWLPIRQRIWMHFSGETGSLKTQTASTLMALYGADFGTTQPLASFRSTVNAIERLGWFLPDCLGLVDDYKPVLIKPREFVDMVHRYADGNDRARLTASAQMQVRKPPRWWVLSTGEDVPVGESSLMARMIVLRFPRRPTDAPYNAGLAKMQRLSAHFPTLTARWASWLSDRGHEQDWAARLELHHQMLAQHVALEVPETPNVNRIARNMAVLTTVWEVFWEFYWEATGKKRAREEIDLVQQKFLSVAQEQVVWQARQAVEQKPTSVFLEAVQEALDSGEFELLPTSQAGTTALRTLAGWYDKAGVYLLPGVYDKVAERKFKAQQALGFSRAELYRLLREEGVLLKTGKTETTITIRVGGGVDQCTRRVLHLKADALVSPLAM